jgi:hypothetical protein
LFIVTIHDSVKSLALATLADHNRRVLFASLAFRDNWRMEPSPAPWHCAEPKRGLETESRRGAAEVGQTRDLKYSRSHFTMTETELKLADTETQLLLAKQHQGDQAILRSCINAFIALGRSTTFVMQKESTVEVTLWYQNQMLSLAPLPMMRFFHDKRTYTMHKGVVTPSSVQALVMRQQRVSRNVLVMGPSRATLWLFDDSEAYGLPKKAPVFPLCDEYLAVLCKLVDGWLERSRRT